MLTCTSNGKRMVNSTYVKGTARNPKVKELVSQGWIITCTFFDKEERKHYSILELWEDIEEEVKEATDMQELEEYMEYKELANRNMNTPQQLNELHKRRYNELFYKFIAMSQEKINELNKQRNMVLKKVSEEIASTKEVKEENILYFEGAGMDFNDSHVSEVGNYRIRTAFKNLDGVEYFIELGNCPIYEYKGKNKKREVIHNWGLHISCLFKLEDKDTERQIKRDFMHIRDNYLYTKKDITKWINENLNCNFDTIEVLDFLHGYRVFADKGGYNLMDNFDVNHERAEKRKEAYNKIDMEYRKALNEKYSKIGLLSMDNDSITIRCYASDNALSKTDLPRVKQVML